MCDANKTTPNVDLRDLNVSRGDATMLYALSRGSHTMRFNLKLDQPIDPGKLRVAIDKTAARYPYFCVSLRTDGVRYFYEPNDAPVTLIHSSEMVTLNSDESNGHIWCVSYDGNSLFVNLYHGRTDGTGAYSLVATLLYNYLSQLHKNLDASGIRTLDVPISEREVRDPLQDLPLIDISSVKRPPVPEALNPMVASNLQHLASKGVILRLVIPEDTFISFCKEHDASPGIMVCALMGRAMRRVNPECPAPLVGAYVVNGRPMLHATESYHNCINRVLLGFDKDVEQMTLREQCATFRQRTAAQADEAVIRRVMTYSGSLAHTILDLPSMDAKVQVARKALVPVLKSCSYTVSYVGKWQHPQIGEHIKEFWLETPAGAFPLIEMSAVGGRIFLAMMQNFSERIYFDALLEQLSEQGIPYVEREAEQVITPDIRMK